MAVGTLAILGSGETAPNMVRVYRDLLADLSPRRGVMLDSSFGFQENVPQLTAKIVDYFATSLGLEIEPASLLDVTATTELQRAAFLEQVESSSFVFAGPGSPSYAMHQWGPVGLGDSLIKVLAGGGVVCFASAAALTLGHFTAPIYELYKVGERPFWIDGLNVLGRFGIDCVVIPHYDNAEGQNHDTRFCYLGERRLLALESMLEPDVATLGIDEHTAAIFDLDAGTLSVRGRGAVHWRIGGVTRDIDSDEPVDLASLRREGHTPTVVHQPTSPVDTDSIEELGHVAAGGGAEGVAAVARLMRLAATGGSNRIDPTPVVEGVLRARTLARSAGNFEISDALRDALVAGGIEVKDGPEGPTWSIKGS